MVSNVNKKLILERKIIEIEIKKFSNIISKYKKKIDTNKKRLIKLNKKIDIQDDEYIYLEYKRIIKEGIYDSSISFKRYKELYLTALKRKIKVINSTKKTLLKSDIDIKKMKSIW